MKIERMRDRLYPEDPLILSTPEIMTRYEVDPRDEVFCQPLEATALQSARNLKSLDATFGR